MRALITKNIDLGSPMKLSSWRKLAIGTWRTAGDPSVYGLLEFDATEALAYIEKLRHQSGFKITLSHFIGKAVAEMLARHPEINAILRLGRLYPRKSVDVFFMVATDEKGKDLSGITIRQADTKTITEIAVEMQDKVQSVREKGDPSFKKMKNAMRFIPGFLTAMVLNTVGFIMYVLNLWTPALGSPRDPFGSVMITNIGSLGLDTAFVPLVPYSRVPLIITVGAVGEQPVVKDHKIAIAPMCKISATFDHRLIDGVHASHMAKTLQRILLNPGAELGSV